MIEFTPEQKAEVNRQLAEARADMHKVYDEKAHQFRELIKRHPVPMANTIGWLAFAVGIGVGWYTNSFFSLPFWK